MKYLPPDKLHLFYVYPYHLTHKTYIMNEDEYTERKGVK